MSRLFVLGFLVLSTASSVQAEGPLQFHLTFDAKQHPQPFTGRAYVMLMKSSRTELASGPSWFNPEPFFAVDVKEVKPGKAIVIDKKALGYPTTVDRITKGTYTIQAVIDKQPGAISFARAPGNLYTVKTKVNLDPTKTGIVPLKLDRVVAPTPFKETDRIKLVDIESKLLTAFHGRPTRMKAGVVLPESYNEQTRKRYPVVYEIPGFSGTHFMASRAITLGLTKLDGVDVIHVTLDPSCHHGHHVFADSANNGPCGRALIEELIPAIEKKFRIIAKPEARLVTGHSSGGWSSLWLQVTYPEFFGGCWSTAPDPVDFRDFQIVNIYRPGENMFVDAKGNRRPIARRAGKAVLFVKPFSDMEVVMGHGGQLASFEAVFSERGSDGQPKRLWDRKTGEIDLSVAKSWEKYDIRLVMERNWKTLAPKLKGKLHIYMGEIDTFYLDGATRLLKASLTKLGGDAVVELFPKKDHSNLLQPPMRGRIKQEMAKTLRAAKVVE